MKLLREHAGLIASVLGVVVLALLYQNIQLSLQVGAVAKPGARAARAPRAAQRPGLSAMDPTVPVAGGVPSAGSCVCTSSSSSSSVDASSSSPAAKPDLSISEMRVRDADDMNIPTFDIFPVNYGDHGSVTPPDVTATARLDMDTTLDVDFTYFFPLPVLNWGESTNVSFTSWDLGWRPPAAGAHRIEVCIDEAQILVETNETNNCKVLNFTVTGPDRPDYLATEARINPNNATVQNFMRFTGIYMNQGTAVGPASTATFSLDRDNDGTYDYVKEVPLQESPRRTMINTSVTPNDLGWTPAAGTHKIRFCVDQPNAVYERRENNNCTEKVFTLQ